MKASELIEHLKSYIDITGGDCEVLVFDKADISCDIKNTSTDIGEESFSSYVMTLTQSWYKLGNVHAGIGFLKEKE